MNPLRAIFISPEHFLYEENDNLKKNSCPYFKISSNTPIFTKSQIGVKRLIFKLKTAIPRSEFNICGPKFVLL